MPSYELVYLKDDGTVAAKISSLCDNDMKAKILAHAMRIDGSSQMEVWQGDTLVYTRPWRREAGGYPTYAERRAASR